MKKVLLFIIITLLLFTGCTTLKIEKNFIQGMIFNSDNEAVGDVKIYLDEKESTLSDIYGHFTLDNLVMNNEYSLKAIKKGYEDVDLNFSLLNSSQVIYLRMYSSAELLTFAEEKIASKEYIEAKEYLKRAEKADGNFLSINYLRAILSFYEGDYDKACYYAESLISEGYNEAYVYILIADIYEKGFENITKAEEYLEKALKLSYSPEIKKRLNRE